MSTSASPLVMAVTKRVRILVALCALGAALPLLAPLVPQRFSTLAWVVDLAVHWQWVYAVAGGLCILWLVGLGMFRIAIPAAAVLALGFGWAGPESYGAAGTSQAQFTVVTANLNANNRDTSALRAWVEALSADIVVLQEVTPGVQSQLERWDAYPHRAIHAQEGPFGIAVLSRHPLEDVRAIDDPEQTLRIRTMVRWGDTLFALAAVHPMPPVSAEYHLKREKLFEAESRWAAWTELPALVAGDFNATPWSQSMRPFVARGMRQASSLSPTWPAAVPLIPIDQVIVSPHWQVLRSGVGPRIGSDHRPVYAVLTKGGF